MSTLSRMPIHHEEIERRRKAMNLTLQEAADRATKALHDAGYDSTCTRQRWNDIEAGRYADPRLSTVEAVSAVLECSIDDLRNPRKRGSR